MKKNWEIFEELVSLIETTLNPDDFIIKQNVKIKDKSGIERQIDVLIESKNNRFNDLIIIECKNYASRIPIEKLESFKTKCDNIGCTHKVFVSKSGFQSGAVKFSENEGIELLTLSQLSKEKVFSWINHNFKVCELKCTPRFIKGIINYDHKDANLLTDKLSEIKQFKSPNGIFKSRAELYRFCLNQYSTFFYSTFFNYALSQDGYEKTLNQSYHFQIEFDLAKLNLYGTVDDTNIKVNSLVAEFVINYNENILKNKTLLEYHKLKESKNVSEIVTFHGEKKSKIDTVNIINSASSNKIGIFIKDRSEKITKIDLNNLKEIYKPEK